MLQIAKLLEQLRRALPQGFSDLAKFNHVNPTLAALYFRYEALRATQAIGEFYLGDTSSLPGRDEELDEFLMPLRKDR